MTDVDLEVVDSFERLFPAPIVSHDWENVLDRAGYRGGRRQSRRRRSGLVLAIAMAMLADGLLVTPALGIGDRILDLVQGAPAPPEVQTFFATGDAYMDVARDPDEVGKALNGPVPVPVIASEARLAFALGTPDGPIHIWTAPTRDGRHCALYQWGDPLPNGQLPLTNIAWGGQDRPVGGPVNGMVGCEFDPDASGLMPVGITLESVSLVRVWFHDPTITRIEIELQGAPPISLPVVAVGNGFMAAGTIPKPTAGHEHAFWSSTAVVARSADGTEVARAPVRHPRPRRQPARSPRWLSIPRARAWSMPPPRREACPRAWTAGRPGSGWLSLRVASPTWSRIRLGQASSTPRWAARACSRRRTAGGAEHERWAELARIVAEPLDERGQGRDRRPETRVDRLGHHVRVRVQESGRGSHVAKRRGRLHSARVPAWRHHGRGGAPLPADRRQHANAEDRLSGSRRRHQSIA